MTLVAGVDSSTQSCKVVICDLGSGAIVRSGRAPHPEGTEVDPEAWWIALQDAVRDAGGLADVAAISVAGQQHGMVVLGEDGRVLRPALLWNDTRSAGAAEDLIREVGAGEHARRSGLRPVASFTSTKLRWLRDAEPEIAARVAAVALPHDWLTWRLRGFGPDGESAGGPRLEELTTDRSDASGTGYWSARTGAYDPGLFETALGRPGRQARGGSGHPGSEAPGGLGRPGSPGTEATAGDADGLDSPPVTGDHVAPGAAVILPRVLGPGEPAGRTPDGVVVGPGAGDNAAAALGLGASPGDVVVSIGTSGTVFAVTERPTNDPTGAVAGFADAAGAALPLVATLNAARVLESIAGLLAVDPESLAELALGASPGSDGLVLVPYFAGERTPDLPEATAALHGMTLVSSTRPNLARAAIEGMLCGLADGLDALRSTGVSTGSVLLIGGAARNPAVRAVAAQVFDLPVRCPAPGEYVAVGAAVQAAWALTGARPEWPVTIEAAPEPDPRPLIREQYHRAAARA